MKQNPQSTSHRLTHSEVFALLWFSSLYGDDENQGIDIPVNSNSKLEEWQFGKRVLGASVFQVRQKWASVSTVENRKGAGLHGWKERAAQRRGTEEVSPNLVIHPMTVAWSHSWMIPESSSQRLELSKVHIPEAAGVVRKPCSLKDAWLTVWRFLRFCFCRDFPFIVPEVSHTDSMHTVELADTADASKVGVTVFHFKQYK